MIFHRLMEIKEEQLKLEKERTDYIFTIGFHTAQILKVLEGGKDGKNKNKRNQ